MLGLENVYMYYAILVHFIQNSLQEMWVFFFFFSDFTCLLVNHAKRKGIKAQSFTPAKQMFSGVYWNQPVCPSVCVHMSVCAWNTSFCQRAGGGLKSYLVPALVSLEKELATFSNLCK